MPVPPPQGSSFSNGSDVDGYGCPPPLPERVPLTSPTASVSSASPDVSQSSLLLLPRARKSSGGAAEGAAGTTTAMTTATAGDPPGGPTEPGTERSPVTSHPPERHAVSFMRVDVPPKPTPMHALAPPAAAPDKRGATGNDTQGAVQPPSPRSRDAHSLDAALHTRVALPPPLSIHHRSLFSKPTTTTTTTATDDDNASLCRSPPCQTTSTGATGPPPRYTERQEVMRPAPREEADDASCGLLSPASPVSCSALATEGVADAVDLVSSPSEGEDGGQEGEEEEEADVPTTTTTTTADDEVLERIMGAVKRAKERVAKRTMQ